MNNIKPLAAVLTYLLCSNIAHASLDSRSERVYLHNQQNAKSEYDSYKADKVNNIDPFEKVRQGYNSNLSKDISESIDNNKAQALKNLLESQNATITENLSGNAIARQAEKQRLYNLYHTEGYFNRHMYDTHLTRFNNDTSKSASVALSSRALEMESVVSDSNEELKGATDSNFADSRTAANNLISLMVTENNINKTEVEGLFNHSQSKIVNNDTLASNAQYYASQWDRNCGSACDLPPPPPPPPTEPDPVDIWEDVNAGCYIDTAKFEKPSRICFNPIVKDSRVIFSVGDETPHDSYNFKDISKWNIEWTGDCVSTSVQCRIDITFKKNYTENDYRVTAVVTHKATGEQKNFTVRATATTGKGD